MLVKALERERELIHQEAFDEGKKEAIETHNRQLAHAMIGKGYTQAVIADLLMLALPEVERLLTTPAQPPT